MSESKAIQAIPRPLTQERFAEVHKAILEAEAPFVKELVKIYSLANTALILKPDGAIEFADPYSRLTPELRGLVDMIQDVRKHARERVMRFYRMELDPAHVR
jgi:hypothetical protein